MRAPSPVLAYNITTGEILRFEGQTEAGRWLVSQGLSKTVRTARVNMFTGIKRQSAVFWGYLWADAKDGEAVAMEAIARKLRARALNAVDWGSLPDARMTLALNAAGIQDPANTLGNPP